MDIVADANVIHAGQYNSRLKTGQSIIRLNQQPLQRARLRPGFKAAVDSTRFPLVSGMIAA